VETLVDDEQMEPDQRRRFLEKARNQAERLSNLVRDLLVLSRIQGDDVALERELLDLRAPLRESADGLRSASAERELLLEVDLPEQEVPVEGDRELLRQIADNLLSNALSYTPPGGRITLRLGVEDGRAVLEVEDTGIGIDPAHQERIFERFYRVDKARSRDLGGTGLGLAIVKHLALIHRGQVSLRSTPGVGSTFRVDLPQAVARQP